MPVDNPRVPGIISRRLDNFVVMSRIGKHVIVGDEALDVGGEGLGPSPFGLFLAALGHWTVVTVTGVAREYGIPLEHIEVEVTHKQNRIVNGPNDPRQREMKIVLIRRNIKVKGPITEEQKERLLWGAQHCPLSNTLEGGPRLIDSIEVMG